MSLETGTKIKDLISSNPPGGDPASQGDDHIRLIKAVLKSQFSGFTEGISITKKESEINSLMSLGAFGLGGAAIPITETQFAAADLATGFYYVTTDTNGTLPLAQNGYGINIDIPSAGYACQFFVSVTGLQLYHHEKVAGSWNAWRTVWDSGNTTKQPSAYDTTAGALINTNSFGMGITTNTPVNPDCGSPPYVGGIYNGRWMSVSWVSGPPGTSAVYGILEWIAISTNGTYGKQIFHDITNGREWSRYYKASSFGPWREQPLVVRESLAQTGYQQIGNSLRQWGQTANIADDGSLVVTFPYPFADVFSVVATPIAAFTGASVSSAGVSSIGNTSFTLTHMSNQAAAVAFKWMAEGYAA